MHGQLRRWTSLLAALGTRRGSAFCLGACLALAGLTGAAHGQQPLTPDQMLQLQQQYQSQRQNGTTLQPDTPPSMLIQPAVPEKGAEPPVSRLEQILSARAGARLQQFGYDQFGSGRSVTIPQTGAVQDDYVLGPGDEIVLSLRGQENGDFRATVDRNGQVVFPRLNPISATGRSVGAFRLDTQAAVKRTLVATTASVSIGRMRQISVLVSGEVNDPGVRQVTGLSSAMDALLLSGGVRKTGSLRNVRIRRGDREFSVDLYSLLTDRGANSTPRLADGDRIVVPNLGATVAVTGLVRRPGIYELPPRQTAMSVQALLALAGGQEVRGRYRLSVLRILPDGRYGMTALPGKDGIVSDSEILFAQLGADQTTSQATLSGATGLAGQYPVTADTKLSDVLKAPGALGPSPYTLFGLVARRDPETLLRTLIAFTPVAVRRGQEDQLLESDDLVRVLSISEARLLVSAVHEFQRQQSAREEAIRDPLSAVPETQTSGSTIGAALLTSAGGTADLAATQHAMAQKVGSESEKDAAQPSPSGKGAAQTAPTGKDAEQTSPPPPPPPRVQDMPPAANFLDQSAPQGGFASNREISNFSQLAQQLGIDPLVLMHFLADHEVVLDGALRAPGEYLVGSRATLQDVVQAAGGPVDWADQSGVELITTTVMPQTGTATTQRIQMPLHQGMLASYVVKPRDRFRFSTIFTDTDVGTATVQGEVKIAGSFPILRGDHLSDLLRRAGGLTSTAFPSGAVFLRRSAAATERDNYVNAAKEIEDQLISAMTRVGNDKIGPETFAALQGFVKDLRDQKALGRISVVANPSELAANPELDTVLQAGDVVYIPPRPSTIAVLGQVMRPGNCRFHNDQTVEEYIEQAGGYAQQANESQTFIVLPDGSARKFHKGWFGNRMSDLPLGSTIVVPRDITPLDLRQTIIDVTQIFSQLAISIASVAVISR